MIVRDTTPTGKRLARTRSGIRLAPDVSRIGRALGGANDPRIWTSLGTVGFFDDRGKFVSDDRDAIFAGRGIGSVVDVRLEPTGDYVTARWSGLGLGQFGSILVPISPGDLVAVLIPDGSLSSPGISIVGLVENVAGEAGQPPSNWNNDRVLWRLRVPLEIDGPAIEIRSPTLTLNDRLVVPAADTI